MEQVIKKKSFFYKFRKPVAIITILSILFFPLTRRVFAGGFDANMAISLAAIAYTAHAIYFQDSMANAQRSKEAKEKMIQDEKNHADGEKSKWQQYYENAEKYSKMIDTANESLDKLSSIDEVMTKTEQNINAIQSGLMLDYNKTFGILGSANRFYQHLTDGQWVQKNIDRAKQSFAKVQGSAKCLQQQIAYLSTFEAAMNAHYPYGNANEAVEELNRWAGKAYETGYVSFSDPGPSMYADSEYTRECGHRLTSRDMEVFEPMKNQAYRDLTYAGELNEVIDPLNQYELVKEEKTYDSKGNVKSVKKLAKPQFAKKSTGEVISTPDGKPVTTKEELDKFLALKARDREAVLNSTYNAKAPSVSSQKDKQKETADRIAGTNELLAKQLRVNGAVLEEHIKTNRLIEIMAKSYINQKAEEAAAKVKEKMREVIVAYGKDFPRKYKLTDKSTYKDIMIAEKAEHDEQQAKAEKDLKKYAKERRLNQSLVNFVADKDIVTP